MDALFPTGTLLVRSIVLSRHEQHFARPACKRRILPRIECLLHDETMLAQSGRELRSRIQANAMRSLSFPFWAAPRGRDVDETGKRIEPPLLCEQGAVGGAPPVAGQE